MSWRFAAVLEGAGSPRRFSSPSIMFCLTQFQQSASISTLPRDPTLVPTTESGSFSRATYAGSWEPIRAPGIRNQPARPRGTEAKQPDLGTIYRGRPPISPDAFKQQFPALRPLAVVSDHPGTRYLSSTWLSHPHHIRPRLPKLTSRRQIQSSKR